MIYLAPNSVSGRAALWLKRWQSEINSLPTYAEQVTKAKEVWPARNVKTNKTFGEVREVLASMASGHVRCVYCEDSCADEVEHIWPKDLYPELTFAWANYLFACGKCNVEKRNNYAVFADATGAKWIDIKRAHDAPVVPPATGDPVLIDPRQENPLHFLLLDLRGTFIFQPMPGLSARDRERVKYTGDILGLNTRDELINGRRTALTTYHSVLHRYVSLTKESAPQDERDKCIVALKKSPHATVWHEMKRWHRRFPGTLPTINALFEAAPEALTW